MAEVFSPEEVVRLIGAARGLKQRVLLMTAYSAGLRVSELVILRITDIDAADMTRRRKSGVEMASPTAAPPNPTRRLFGVTGDLAHEMIFPTFYARAKRGVLTVPVVGVAAPKWSMAQRSKRVKDSIERSGGIDNQRDLHHLLSRGFLRRVDV